MQLANISFFEMARDLLYKHTFNYNKKNLIGPTTRIVSFVCQVLSSDFE
jgi:hypothetical protein